MVIGYWLLKQKTVLEGILTLAIGYCCGTVEHTVAPNQKLSKAGRITASFCT